MLIAGAERRVMPVSERARRRILRKIFAQPLFLHLSPRASVGIAIERNDMPGT